MSLKKFEVKITTATNKRIIEAVAQNSCEAVCLAVKALGINQHNFLVMVKPLGVTHG